MEENQEASIEDIEREIREQQEENSYLKSRNMGLQDSAESSFMPKSDSNVIEFKLSAEELLERIEHYLRGDVLKNRTGENGEVETFYSVPTKKITVSLFENKKLGSIYVINEHQDIINENKNQPQENNWEVLSLIQGKGEDVQEMIVEDNYKDFLIEEVKKGLTGKSKKFIPRGQTVREIPDNSRINLNEYGISEIMNTLSMYVNKETFLSFYKEDRINEIMGDIGDKLNEFLYINGKMMGLDTEYKKTKYPLMMITILHIVESAYRRALLGNENRGIHERILITQHQPQQGVNQMPMQIQKKKWSPFNKSTW